MAARVSLLVWLALIGAGLVNLLRAPYATDHLGWIAIIWAIFVVAAALLALAVLGVIALGRVLFRRRWVPPAAVVGAVFAVITLALFPVERVWFVDETAHGPVPLAQALVMEPSPGGPDGTYRPPGWMYAETCCD